MFWLILRRFVSCAQARIAISAAAATAEHRMLEPIEGGSSRERQTRSKASDVVLTLSSASMECAALAVVRAKVSPILRPFWLQNLVKLLPNFGN